MDLVYLNILFALVQNMKKKIVQVISFSEYGFHPKASDPTQIHWTNCKVGTNGLSSLVLI